MEGDTRGRRVLFYKRGEYLEKKPANQEPHAYRCNLSAATKAPDLKSVPITRTGKPKQI
jgi:hypothetical protein